MPPQAALLSAACSKVSNLWRASAPSRIQQRVMPPAMFSSFVLGLGFCNGLRTLTPVSVLCWGSQLRWYSFAHTPFAFLGSPISLWVFTGLAAGELVADKLPKTPARTQAFPTVARAAFGGACGAAIAEIAGAELPLGVLAGVAGALAGTYIGYLVRRALTRGAGLPDLPVALVEDIVAVGGSFFLVSRF